jgi:hypothetical protein
MQACELTHSHHLWHAVWACFAMLLCCAVSAGQLDPGAWKFSGSNAATMHKAVDNNLDTCWESDGPQTPGTAVTIDLGRSVQVYRVFLTCGRELSKFPRSLNVYVGESPDTMRRVAGETSRSDADSKDGYLTALRTESLFRFAPAQGRYVKLEIGVNGSGLPWAIAEMDIHAATKDEKAGATVIVDGKFLTTADGKPQGFNLMKLAAEELRYYLMELTGAPVRIVAAANATSATGLRFRLVTPPAETVPSPEPDPRNLDDVSVTRDGEEIQIAGPTTRAVLYGAYEFLKSQGVRWLFADANGDMVPKAGKLNLSVLPINYRPPFSTRGLIWPGVVGMTEEQFNLFQLRHGFNMAMGMNNKVPLGTVPRMNCGFGWAHTMGDMFDGQEKTHPEWWPGPYRKGGWKVPCTSNPAVLDYIYQRIEGTLVARAAAKLPPLQGFSVHPNDSPIFCECARCEGLFGKPERVSADGAEESNGTWDYAPRHFYLINALAERLKKAHPALFLKTLAYANHELAPKSYARMPENVLIDICPWWRSLPVDAPQNAPIRDNIKAWGPKCGSIGIWSYVLIYNDTTFGHPSGEKNLLTTNLSALADQNRFYRQVGIRQVGTQLYGPQHHWPWGFYAFAATSWNPDVKAAVLKDDFFKGYYGEAWQPMLRWYTLMEETALAQNLDTDSPNPALFAHGNIEKLRGYLAEARKLAVRWEVKERVETARIDTEWTYERSGWQTHTSDRPYPCFRMKTPPAIDGTLTDAAWQTLPEMQGFRIAATRVDAAHPGQFASTRSTSFRMGWDDKYLYLGARMTEPDMAALKAADAKQKEFAYRDALEIFFAPEAPPYYRQTIIDSAGFAWGPTKISAVNSHQYLKDPDFVCKTAYGPDGWTLEARFPLAMLTNTLPKEGTAWAANLVRPCTTTKDGEQYTSWSDMPRFHFHQYWLGAWSVIEFKGQAPANPAGLEAAMNAEYLRASRAYSDQSARLRAFDAQVAGKPNLNDMPAIKSDDRDRRQYDVAWNGKSVTCNAVRINWQNKRLLKRWYTLEYWDGTQFRLIEDRRDNRCAVSVHDFPPITTTRLRLTTWDEMIGWRDMTAVKSIEVYLK